MSVVKIISFSKVNLNSFQRVVSRNVTSTAKKENLTEDNKIDSWQIHEYGGIEELKLTKARLPIIQKPDDVLVDVKAASVNPIDVAMTGGYGSVFLNLARQVENCSFDTPLEFPLTLGRDFSGVIRDLGFGARNFKLGDEVWGVVPVQCQGSHADRVVTNRLLIQKKPDNISMVESGSMLYTAMTAWSALKVTGGLGLIPARGKNVLVLGGSGGVGTMAVQMLKNWGAQVVSTCSPDAVPLLESLGVTVVVDYTRDDADRILQQEGKYDIILDCAGHGTTDVQKYLDNLKEYRFSKYITLTSPLLKNVNEHGVIGGMVKNAGELITSNITSGVFTKSSSVRWAFFLPVPLGIEEITHDVQRGKLVPCIDKVFKFNDAPSAYQKVKDGHLRGKVVLDHSE